MNKNIKIVLWTILTIVLFGIGVPWIFGYRIGYFEYVEYDYVAIDAIGQLFGIVLSSFLTYMIIRQTKSIADMQKKIEINSENNQINLQKRQLRIDLFDKRLSIMDDIFKMFTHIGLLEDTIKRNKNDVDKGIAEVIKIHNGIKSLEKNYLDMHRLNTAEFIFDGVMIAKVRSIVEEYSELDGKITVLSLFPEEDEREWRIEVYASVKQNIGNIIAERDHIVVLAKNELNIAGLDR